MPRDDPHPYPEHRSSALKRGAAWLTIAVAAVGGYEGLRTQAYKDPVGIPTICFGYTHGVQMGDKKTVEECKELLVDELLAVEKQFDQCSPGVSEKLKNHPKIKAPVISLLYNTGPGKAGVKDGYCWLKNGNPSSMRRYINAGEYERACNEFPKWATAVGGVPLPGLRIRRADEQRMCLEGVREWNFSLDSQP